MHHLHQGSADALGLHVPASRPSSRKQARPTLKEHHLYVGGAALAALGVNLERGDFRVTGVPLGWIMDRMVDGTGWVMHGDGDTARER